jgi:hypothetical protein
MQKMTTLLYINELNKYLEIVISSFSRVSDEVGKIAEDSRHTGLRDNSVVTLHGYETSPFSGLIKTRELQVS